MKRTLKILRSYVTIEAKMQYRSRTSMKPEFLEAITIVMYVDAKLEK